MDLITFGVFFFFFLLCVASVLLISVYGTSEQSFEDGLISKDGDKKKERKASGKKSDEAGTDASTVHQRKKPGKFGKKNTEEKESKPVETKPVEPVVAKAKEPEVAKPEVAKPEAETHKIVKKDKPTAPAEVPAPVKVAKPEEAPVKKVAKEEKRGAKSKILIEEVESEVKVAPVLAAPEEPKPEPKKPVKAKPVEKVEAVPEIVKEVAKIEEVVQKAPEVKTVEAPAPKVAKKKNEGPAKAGNSGKLLDPNAIISAVKTVSLEETQVQQLIDILLNKQNNSNTSVNGFGSSDDWSGDKSANQTKRQLTETQTLLEEEKSKTKSLTERLAVLRTELNQTKSAQISAQRMVDEFQVQTQRANATWEGRLKHEIDQRHREVHGLQTQVNLHLSQVQQLQATIENVQQKQQQQHHQQQNVDVALVETLRETNAKLEAELANLQNQLHSAVAQLNEANEVKQMTLAELSQAKEELVAKLAQTTSEVSQKKSKLEDLERTCKELQTKVSDVTSAQKATEAENVRLTEENVRLSEQHKQQAVVVSTPTKAEKISESFDKNIYLKEQSAIAKKWEDFYKDFTPEKSRPSLLELYTNEPAVNGSAVNGDHDSDKQFKIEKILAHGDVMLSGLVGCYCTVKSKLDQVESELNAQKTKNNELREKNWKVVEALNTAEQSYQKLLKSQSTAPTTSQNTAAAVPAVDLETLKSNTQAEVKKILMSHFPALKVPESSEFPTWAGQFIERVQEKVRENAQADFKVETETLEKQANHYKAILSETELTLLKLQEEVESMESGFESKISDQKTALAEKESKLAQVSKETSSLADKSAALESKLEESNKRIKELEEKSKLVENSSETESSNQELVQLKSELAKEQKGRAELSEQVAKLNTVVSTSQKALEQEKRITEKLQLQLSERTSDAPISQVPEAVENGNSKSPQCENETVTPQSGSIASLEMSDTTSTASPAKSGKSKKKKFLGIFKSK